MKHYLIDSENVGDFWIPLLEIPADQAELIVFYTKNSPHMSYDSLIKLKESDRTVIFIKCYEGTNALDFQLCSELGFRIACNENDDFIIVTNDTGYDAAVKYWRHKQYSVKRIAGKDMRTGSRRRGNLARSDVAAEVSAILHKLVQAQEPDEKESEGADILRDEVSEAEENGSLISDQGTEADPAYETGEPDETEDDGYDEEPDNDPGDSFPDDEGDAYPPEEEDDEYAPDYDDSDDSDDTCYDPEGTAEEDLPGPDSEDEEYDSDEESSEEPLTDPEEEDAAHGPSEEENGNSSDEEAFDEEDHEEAPSEDRTGADEPAEPEESEDPAEKSEEVFVPDHDEIVAIVNCIGMENLAELHNQLIQFYGDNGKDIYLALKSGALAIEKMEWEKDEKFLYYCTLILRHSDEPEEALTEENIREFAEFVQGAESKRKNLNSLRYALLKHYGKEKGRRYYFMLKPYVKVLNQM